MSDAREVYGEELRRGSALLSFTAQNVRSFRDRVHISFLGSRLTEQGVARHLAVEGSSRLVSVLPAAGIFGANASGKSTILKAMADMRTLVTKSFQPRTTGPRIYRHPFLLHSGYQQPSYFRVELIIEGVRWQYGFEIDNEQVLEESAYHYPRGRRARVFHRKGDDLDFGAPFRSRARFLEKFLRDSSLITSVAKAAEADFLAPLYTWFSHNLRLAEAETRGLRSGLTADLVDSPRTKASVLNMLQIADLGVSDARKVLPDPEEIEHLRKILRPLIDTGAISDFESGIVLQDPVRLTHYGPTGSVELHPQYESEGTKVWIGLVGSLLAALKRGDVLLADELDTSLHPHLVERVVRLFQERQTNERCAQLIFNAHDTNLLGDSDNRVIGRDQIWFAEKDLDGVSSLVSLADYTPRGDEALERRYLQGRYGAVPYINPADIYRATATMEDEALTAISP